MSSKDASKNSVSAITAPVDDSPSETNQNNAENGDSMKNREYFPVPRALEIYLLI